MDKPQRLYECLLDYCGSTQKIDRIVLGQVWTVCQTRKLQKYASGLSMTPPRATRTLSWSGTLAGQSLKDVACWIQEWDPFKASVGLAVLNCGINNNSYIPDGIALDVVQGNSNLAVFEHFVPQLSGRKVVVIGHYPGIDSYIQDYGWQVIERMPQSIDYPDPACEYLLPEADWVFISGSSIANKTFPRLAELSRSATTVLMGPSVPWLAEFYDFGIDYLAGIQVNDADNLFKTAMEGGGIRIFDSAVQYQIIKLDEMQCLSWLKKQISQTAEEKETLTQAMNHWYTKGNANRFPQYSDLNDTNLRLSRLDSAYKKRWDAQQQPPRALQNQDESEQTLEAQ